MESIISILPIIFTTTVGIIGLFRQTPDKPTKNRLSLLGYFTIALLILALCFSLKNHFEDRAQIIKQRESLNELKKSSQSTSEKVSAGFSRTSKELSEVSQMVSMTRQELETFRKAATLQGALQITGNQPIREGDVLAAPELIIKSSRGDDTLKDIVFNFSNIEKYFEQSTKEIPEKVTNFIKSKK